MPTRAGKPTHVKVEDEKLEILDSLISMNLTQCIDSSLKEEEDFNFQFLEQAGMKMECDNSLEGFHFGNGVGSFDDEDHHNRELDVVDMDSSCKLLQDLPATSSSLCLDFESLDSVDGRETTNEPETEIGEEEALLLAAATTTVADESSDRESIGPVDKKEEQTSSGQCSNKGSKGAASSGQRKTKVDWTQELHRRFVQAVEQLGVEKAIPSRILELMGVQCLTRHNIASHLQKYRSHRRHMIARDVEAASWRHCRPLTWARSQREGNAWLAPIQTSSSSSPAAHPYASAGLPTIQPRLPAHGHHHMGAPLVVWGHPTVDHSPSHMWQQPLVNTLPFSQEPDSRYWQQVAPACIDSWTHPSLSPAFPYPFFGAPYASSFCASQRVAPGITSEKLLMDESLPVAMYQTTAIDSDISAAAGAAACSKPSDFPPPQEILDAVISEALANPCTPLPLGLKPPSVAGVMAELFRQGIHIVAPSTS